MRQRAVPGRRAPDQVAQRVTLASAVVLAGLFAQVAAQAQSRGLGGLGGGLGSPGGLGGAGGGVHIPPPPPVLPPIASPPPVYAAPPVYAPPPVYHPPPPPVPLPPPPPPLPTLPPVPWPPLVPPPPPPPTPIPTAPPVSVPAPVPAAPPVSESPAQEERQRAQEEARVHQRERVMELWKSLEALESAKQHDEVLRRLDEMVELLEQDGGVPDALAEVRQLRERFLVQRGQQLAAEGKPQAALDVLRRAAPSAARQEAIAHALMAAKRPREALDSLAELATFDMDRAARLRGAFLLTLGAVPLALEALQPLAREPDVAAQLRLLQQKGLHQFRRRERGDWLVYEASAGTRPARTLAYWFPARDGAPDAVQPVEVSMRPAPRRLTFGLVVRHLLRLHWPVVHQPREYELAVHANGQRQVVAIWDWEPDAGEIVDAARRGLASAGALQQAEEFLHAGRREEALRIALEHGRSPGWFFPPQANYAALAMAVQAAAELGDAKQAQAQADRIADWHPLWGALVLARAWENAQKPLAARAAYEAAVAAAPLRPEAYQKLAEFEWGVAADPASEDRPAAFLRAQKAARRLQQIDAAEGLWLRAQVAYELQGYALAAALLRQLAQIGPPGEAPEAALEMQALLENLRQWEFVRVGEPVAVAGTGLALHAYRSRQRPPADAALRHHGVEILVLDADGDLVETFALTSQGVPPGAPRQYLLDRVNAFGLQQLRVYGARPPSLERLLQGVAAL